MEWISVKDRLPIIPPRYYNSECNVFITPLSVEVIVTDGVDSFQATYHKDGKFISNWLGDENITHWMPLPPPPTKK